MGAPGSQGRESGGEARAASVEHYLARDLCVHLEDVINGALKMSCCIVSFRYVAPILRRVVCWDCVIADLNKLLLNRAKEGDACKQHGTVVKKVLAFLSMTFPICQAAGVRKQLYLEGVLILGRQSPLWCSQKQSTCSSQQRCDCRKKALATFSLSALTKQLPPAASQHSAIPVGAARATCTSSRTHKHHACGSIASAAE